MGKHFWLIQRGAFRNIKSATKFLGGSSDHLIDPDYMGSAEFEWGAIPKAYRRIMGKYDKYSLHITDLSTIRGVPFCIYCIDSNYVNILNEIKAYLGKPYQLKEFSNIEAHFTEKSPFGIDYHKFQTRTNFWWCIDISRTTEDVGDWIAFVGATDRQNAFNRIIESDHTNWWLKKPVDEQEKDLNSSFSMF